MAFPVLLALKSASIYVLGWVLWSILRPYLSKSSLDKVTGPPSQSWLTGNVLQAFDSNGWLFHKQLARDFGGLVKLNGLFGDKFLYVSDPKALQHIVLKDQHIFEETESFIQSNRLIFGMGLLSTLGDHHRKQRKMLTPAFSTGHLRNLVPIFYEVTRKLEKSLVSVLKGGPKEIDMLEWTSRTALELVGQSGLGYSFDSLAAGGTATPFTVAVKNLSPTVFSMAFARPFVPFLVKLGPASFRRFLVEHIPWQKLQALRGIIDVMDSTSREIFNAKKHAIERGEGSLLDQVGRGKDIMSIILKQNLEASNEDRLPESELLGQISTLTFAATDSTSGALARVLHLLAQNPDVQAKLCKEVTAAGENGDIPHEKLVNLPYLDAICRETLRLYPPIPFIGRRARTDAVLPLLDPIKDIDGNEMTEILVPAGTDVLVGITATNTNPRIWGDDAEHWKPERWLSPLPKNVHDASIPGVYSNMMTFSGGLRACIGFKFSELEMKIVLAVLAKTFTFSPSEQEIAWKLGVVTTPIINGCENNIGLPLKVGLINPA